MQERTKHPAVQRAIQLAGGSQNDLAKALGVSQALVGAWLNNVKPVTAKRAVQIEQTFSGKVTREELRPDLFVRSAA